MAAGDSAGSVDQADAGSEGEFVPASDSREEAPVSGPAVPVAGGVPRRSRRAAEAPVDAVPEFREERESQARARNREALRAYRALAERTMSDDDPTRIETPTRRQLRLQQAHSSSGGSGAPSPSGDGDDAAVSSPDGPDAADASRDGAVELSEASAGAPHPPVAGGRRDRRRRQTDGSAGAVRTDAPMHRPDAPAGPDGPGEADRQRIEDMTVEQALEARNALAGEAAVHASGLTTTDDPFVVDLDLLAQQKALADRASVLNARARRMQEIAEQNQQRAVPPSDPTTAHNLSIVTPPEYVRVPGGNRSVLRAPTTSHIPVVLPRPQPVAEPAAPGAKGADSAGAEPIGARSAFGLEPLDAMTAGLGRLRRLRYVQYSLLGVGAAALMTGIIMTVSSLNG